MASREQVVAYRAAVHGLTGAGVGATPDAGAVLDVGAQDHPIGATARLALELRGAGGADMVLVHSVRAAMHLHRSADLGLLAAALRIDDGAELAQQSIGPFGQEIGPRFGTGLDEVAAVMADVMSDGRPRTKGELSGAVSPRVARALAPWCEGCGVHHVHDALFRFATLQAGLTIEVESPRVFRFLPPTAPVRRRGGPERVDDRGTRESRAQVVRRFVHAAGPVRPAHLAAWLSLTPSAAGGWWSLVEDELHPVTVDGRKGWMLAADMPLLEDPPEPPELRLLGPYDPVTEVVDRELLLPDAGDRRRVWSPAGNPGIVLRDGEIAGTWRRRAAKGRLDIAVTTFDGLPDGWADAIHGDAQAVGRFFGASDVRVGMAS
ncbi:DNA glycosylase AlkZ-like family protein [Jiangella gansuensis]|uniref:DNA glycosylase AlkZ-like family protein n=1 Tax=Jiangella gansuensis TaxID=281473 RepID=UPI00047C5CCC|nr:crosslink repair DNA glycosylase YcaQ family protein [Jiangella gansuensis]